MSQKARLDRVEGSLGPVAAVIRWFMVAHNRFGSLTAYLAHQTGLPQEARAELQIVSQVQASGAGSIKPGRSAESMSADARAARDALFRYRLAVMIEIYVAETLASLRDVRDELLADKKAFVAADQLRRDAQAGGCADLFEWLAAMEAGYAYRVVDYVRAVFTVVEEGEILERRYFDGHSMLFADAIALEHELLAMPPVLADVVEPSTGDRPSDADAGAEERGPPGGRFAALKDEAHTLAADLVAHLVDIVRVDTMLLLGEFEQAYALERALSDSSVGPELRIAMPSPQRTPRRRRR
jgi:hypothetical protein